MIHRVSQQLVSAIQNMLVKKKKMFITVNKAMF